MSRKIRILIADDHAIVREGLRALFASEPDFELVAEATDGVEAVNLVQATRPDVILLDIVMPRKDGLSAIDDIIGENPQARILVLTTFAEDEKVFPAIRAGALGYLLKDSSPQELIQAIRNVYVGEAFLHPIIARKIIHELKQPMSLPPASDPLTEREIVVLRLVAKGLSNVQIAKNLVVSERTVRTHVSHILGKLHLANRTQMAIFAFREGFAKIDDI
jgi:two-component system, NarL family, response regulator LiaR